MDPITIMLDNLNPWWAEGSVPPELSRIPRDLGLDLDALLATEEILTLVGVRRCGKSTMLFQIADRLIRQGVPPGNILLMDFEDPRASGMTVGEVLSSYRQRKDPSGRIYVLLDEVQASTGWERWVRSEYERRRGVKFIVTGSSSSIVRGELARVLTGRTLTVPIHPLSFREFLRFRKVDLEALAGDALVDKATYQLARYMEVGGFPKSVLEGEAAGPLRLKEYLDAILYRDIVFRHGANPEKVERLATYLLSNIGTLQRDSRLASSTHLSVDTVSDYLAYLEDAMLIVRVGPLTFKTKPSSARALPSKYYCVDTGLRNSVARRRSPDAGWLVENVVCMEMVRRGLRPLYWRNAGDVDFVVGGRAGPLHPVNVCFSDEVPEREYKGLAAFSGHVPPPVGPPVLMTRSTEGTARGVAHVPVWRWLLQPPSADRPFGELA
jgi:predicted AAA+ superfamily ATPase